MDKDKFRELVQVMDKLRSANGCPWDKEQTHKSLRQYLLEETYEVLESIDQNDPNSLKEELGDLLLQVVFHAQIADESQQFNVDDVIDSIVDKLIRRHPNVFGDQKIDTAEEQKQNWEKIKRNEGRKSVIGGVPKQLPSLLRAIRIQEKVAHVGFDWTLIDDVWTKFEEEISELHQAISNKNQDEIEEEMGDLLFTLVNISKFLKINPEDALRGTIEKFIYRFQKLEQRIESQNKNIEECSLAEMDDIWNQIKNSEP